MADIKAAYAGSTSITCALASLADAGARESTVIDNSSNLYLDAQVYLAMKLQAGSPANEKVINVWFYASEDGTNFTDNATGSDASVTLRDPHNFLGPAICSTPDSGALTYKLVIPSVARYLGSPLPREWGIVVENQTGITFDATEGNHAKSYTGTYVTSS